MIRYALPFLLIASLSHAQDWSRGQVLGPGGRPNPYESAPEVLREDVKQGRIHALNYPITVTGILLPYTPMKNFFESSSANPLQKLLEGIFRRLSPYQKLDDVERWLGLHKYPEEIGEGPFFIPRGPSVLMAQGNPVHRMGFTTMETSNGTGFTISCAQCHSSHLFGRKVIGLTNRFPRANEFFLQGLTVAPYVSKSFFQWALNANPGEASMYERSRLSMSFIGAKQPVQLGLDTSLAQVALSLAHRAPDEWAERKPVPLRAEPLTSLVADSKPAVWWNVKYKNRFLSDGSVVSGNPIFTNFIWNEIGRGTDLHELESWLASNESVVRELTTAVFAAEAPRWTDFFAAESINEDKAKRGEKVFIDRCQRCHGIYEKAWSQPGAEQWPLAVRLKTTKVTYRDKTPVIDVGTDPGRYLGMKSLEALNTLSISKRNGIVIEAQKGYVPPPLVGIWARWPYFHNNSAPSLCAVITVAKDRPKTYWAHEALSPSRDFDSDCVGYPTNVPNPVPAREFYYDTRKKGLSNSGHEEKILVENGRELMTMDQKRELIEFLKTL